MADVDNRCVHDSPRPGKRAGRYDISTCSGNARSCSERRLREGLGRARIVDVSDDALALRQAYLEADILTRDSADDALHVALATVSRCALIVSWNFRHIVHYRKTPLHNAMNALKGYPSLRIHSPQEVIEYEDQDI